jgi:hypothetical protein
VTDTDGTFSFLAGSYVREDGTVGMLAHGDARPTDAAKGELERLDNLGAFAAPEQAAGEGGSEGEVPTEPGAVLAWMERQQKVSDVLAMVGTNPELAQAALDAEVSVTGGEPRKSLKEGLEKVIEDAKAAPAGDGGEGEGGGENPPS